MCFLQSAGGFGSYLFAMSDVMAKVSEEPISKYDTKNPGLGWMIGFLYVVSFLGLFSVVPLRKVNSFILQTVCKKNMLFLHYLFLLLPDNDC